MKFKALRYKKEHNKFQEFVHLYVNENLKIVDVFTGDLPNPQPMTATLEGMQEYYESKGIDVDLSQYELVELDVIEAGEVGADIRNKLGNYSNLVQLVELFLDEKDRDVKKKLKKLIRKEIVLGNETVKYLAKLF